MKLAYKALIAGVIIVIAGAGLFAVLSSERSDEEKPLKMALILCAEAQAEVERYQPIAEYLEEQIGQPVELMTCTDYTTVITALKYGDCDIARLGHFSYVLAVEEAKVEPLLCEELKRAPRRMPTTRISSPGLITVNVDYGVNKPQDVFYAIEEEIG